MKRLAIPPPKHARWLLLPAMLLVLSCFDIERSVDERLRLIFLAEGGLHLEHSVALRHSEDATKALAQRLRQLETDLLEGWDPWRQRFDQVEASAESFFWEKEAGRVVYVERNLVLEDPRVLEIVLADTPILNAYRVEDGVAEISLFPGYSGRASRQERREMDEILDIWSGEIAKYLLATETLYNYLERRPDRAIPIFGALFADEEDYDPLTSEEEALIEALGDNEVVGVLDVDLETGYSLDELSRRVFDPFPARFEVEIPGPAVAVEGFQKSGDHWVVPGLGLWSALAALEGVWLTPDPLLAWVEHMRSVPDLPFDVIGFAARKRMATSADADEVREALVKWLTPARVYRLAWSVPVS